MFLDRPVFEMERCGVTAWEVGGGEAEVAAKKSYMQRQRDKERKDLQDFRDWQNTIRIKKAAEMEKLKASGEHVDYFARNEDGSLRPTAQYYDQRMTKEQRAIKEEREEQAKKDAKEERELVLGNGISKMGKSFWSDSFTANQEVLEPEELNPRFIEQEPEKNNEDDTVFEKDAETDGSVKEFAKERKTSKVLPVQDSQDVADESVPLIITSKVKDIVIESLLPPSPLVVVVSKDIVQESELSLPPAPSSALSTPDSNEHETSTGNELSLSATDSTEIELSLPMPPPTENETTLGTLENESSVLSLDSLSTPSSTKLSLPAPSSTENESLIAVQGSSSSTQEEDLDACLDITSSIDLRGFSSLSTPVPERLSWEALSREAYSSMPLCTPTVLPSMDDISENVPEKFSDHALTRDEILLSMMSSRSNTTRDHEPAP